MIKITKPRFRQLKKLSLKVPIKITFKNEYMSLLDQNHRETKFISKLY